MRICLVSSGFEEKNITLQPWNFIIQSAISLSSLSFDVRILTDGDPSNPRERNLAGLPVIRTSRINKLILGSSNQMIQSMISMNPEVILWHFGIFSYFAIRKISQISNAKIIALLTTPVYFPEELSRLGVKKLLRNIRLTLYLIFGKNLLTLFIRLSLKKKILCQVIVECETTRKRLISCGVPGESIHVIKPGIDPDWVDYDVDESEIINIRKSNGFTDSDYVIGYFGPPKPFRGLDILIESIPQALKQNPDIKLLILSRQWDEELDKEFNNIQRLLKKLDNRNWSRMVEGFLPKRSLIRMVASCDLIALPFEIITSDVPLSVLETVALGVPIISTNVACIPELIPRNSGFLIEPGNVEFLIDAICSISSGAISKSNCLNSETKRSLNWMTQGENIELWGEVINNAFIR